MDSLSTEDAKEFNPEEIAQMFDSKTPDEFKLLLNKLEDFNDIVRIFQSLNEKQVFAYFTGMSDPAWKETTPAEW